MVSFAFEQGQNNFSVKQTIGGVNRVFMELFSVKGEKLLKASQCYLSTSGPIAGLLFISTHKVAFCREKSIKISSPKGELSRVRYKVIFFA